MTAILIAEGPLGGKEIMSRIAEEYSLTCWACKRAVILPVGAVHDHVAACPQCNAYLRIEFRPADEGRAA